jgi:TPR repeat protein
MIASSRHAGRLYLLAVALAAGSAHAAEHWMAAKTPHFELYSDASEDDSRSILVGLENFRANFLRVMPIGNASEPLTKVVVFRRESEFDAYRPLYQGKPRDVAGYFLSSPDEVMIAMTTDINGPQADPREVIYHEYVHLLVDTRKARYPVWLNEGLAEVFSTFRVADGKVVFGEPKNQHVALLQQSRLWPLSRLFAVTLGSPDYNEDARAGIFYAESWALTHYLLFGADRTNSAKLSRFAQLLDAGNDVPASFHDAFGMDFGTLESALRKYLDGGSGYYRTRSPPVAQTVPVAFRPASDLERDAALLDLRWRVRRNGDAAAAALALLQRDPKPPGPHELLAAIAAAAGDMEGAHEHWRQAADCNSDNPWVYLQLLGEALAPYEGAGILDVRLTQEQVTPWRAWAARALALSPANHEAMEDALTVEAMAERMDLRVVNRIQGAAVQSRDRAQALLALAILHWRSGQPRDARALVNLADAEPRADMATRAAANALRYRLPAAAGAKEATGAAAGNRGAIIALDIAHEGDAGKFLDTLLAERGSTAPRLKLERWVVRPSGAGSDEWDRSEQLRQAARAGDAGAMFGLALAYARGSGVEFAPPLALEWLQQAVAHGVPMAPEDLDPAQKDAASAVRYLRNQPGAPWSGALPPLDDELAVQIGQAAARDDRQAPQVVYRGSPRFPAAIAQQGGTGEARVLFVIRGDGHPDAIKSRDFSDPAAASAAEACVRSWRFLPTIRDGKPADTLAEVTVVFDGGSRAAAPKPPAAPGS